MGKSNDTLLYVGGAVIALGGIYFLTRPNAVAIPGLSVLPGTNTPVTTAGGTPTIPGAPAPPVIYSDSYFHTYQYPALVALYPNLQNSNYQLTDQDAQNYNNNYLDIAQWLGTVVGPGKPFSTTKQALQYHWSHNGVAERRSFVPFLPNYRVNYVPPPQNANSSGGSSVLSTVGTVASIAAMFLGPNDEVLNDGEVELIMTMAPVTEKIIGFYLKSDKTLVDSISYKLNEIVKQYAS